MHDTADEALDVLVRTFFPLLLNVSSELDSERLSVAVIERLEASFTEPPIFIKEHASHLVVRGRLFAEDFIFERF
jgi:hypothetical protein